MTIVVAAATPEGIVFGSDSRMTSSRGRHYRIGSDSAHKTFAVQNMIEETRFGVAAYGQAFVGLRTVYGVMADIYMWRVLEQKSWSDVHEFAAALGEFFRKEFLAADETAPEEGWSLGFLVAGYDASEIGRLLEVPIPSGQVIDTGINTSDRRGVAWRGQTGAVRRLIDGVDFPALERAGYRMTKELVDDVRENVTYRLLYPATIRDAADFSSFVIRTTIEMQRFSDGTEGEPGRFQVAEALSRRSR